MATGRAATKARARLARAGRKPAIRVAVRWWSFAAWAEAHSR